MRTPGTGRDRTREIESGREANGGAPSDSGQADVDRVLRSVIIVPKNGSLLNIALAATASTTEAPPTLQSCAPRSESLLRKGGPK